MHSAFLACHIVRYNTPASHQHDPIFTDLYRPVATLIPCKRWLVDPLEPYYTPITHPIPQPQTPGSYWEWKGHRIRYQRSGDSGPAVLLVHGFGGNW